MTQLNSIRHKYAPVSCNYSVCRNLSNINKLLDLSDKNVNIFQKLVEYLRILMI